MLFLMVQCRAPRPMTKKSPCSSSLTPHSELNAWKNRQHFSLQAHHLLIFSCCAFSIPRAHRYTLCDHWVAFTLSTIFSFLKLFPWFPCHFALRILSILKSSLSLLHWHFFPLPTIKYRGSQQWEWSQPT